jgi:hypothetical protein
MQRQVMMTLDQINVTGECKAFAINERDGCSVSSAEDYRLEFQREGPLYQNFNKLSNFITILFNSLQQY